MEQAKSLRSATDEEFAVWLDAEIAKAKSGLPYDEAVAVKEAKLRGHDPEPVKAAFALALEAWREAETRREQKGIKPSLVNHDGTLDVAALLALPKPNEATLAKLIELPPDPEDEEIEVEEEVEEEDFEDEPLEELRAELAEIKARLPAILPQPTPLTALPSVLTEVDYDQALAAMNERHAVIGNIGGKCMALDWIESPIDKATLIPSFQRRSDIENRYSHHGVRVDGKKIGLGKWWWDNPRRSNYRGVLFEPGGALELPDGHLNLWRGWGVVPEPGDWSRLRWHIEHILAGSDPKASEYILRWASYGFQHPDRPAETALIFRGPEGCGKGVFGRALRRIYGPHGFQISQPKHLTGNFNAHLWTCCYLFADEAFWAGDRQGEGILKSLITEDVLMIEKKRIDQFQAKNFIKLMMASNEDWVVPAGQNARRYQVNDVDKRYAEGVADDVTREAYFGPLYEECANGGLAAMLWDLQRLDLEGWHPRMIYRTAALTHQKRASLRGNPQWFHSLLQSGRLPKPVANRLDTILTDDLVAWAKANFRGCEYLTDESLSDFLVQMGFSTDLASKGGNKYRGPKGGKRGWQFPPLTELRAGWTKRFGGNWEWDEDIEDWGK